MTEQCKFIVDFLGCDCEVFQPGTDGGRIHSRYIELKGDGISEGFIPLCIAVSDTLVDTLEPVLDDYDIEEIPEGLKKYRETVLSEAEELDVSAFFSEKLEEYTELYEEEGIDLVGNFVEVEHDADFIGYLGGRIEEEMVLAKIPTKKPWELAAWIPMGGFNDCPMPFEQVAVFRYWYEKYGATPKLVTYDVWELTVKKPPHSTAEAEIIAEEQFAFCSDIVTQAQPEVASIRGLASILEGEHIWQFWWD